MGVSGTRRSGVAEGGTTAGGGETFRFVGATGLTVGLTTATVVTTTVTGGSTVVTPTWPEPTRVPSAWRRPPPLVPPLVLVEVVVVPVPLNCTRSATTLLAIGVPRPVTTSYPVCAE